MSYNDRFSMRWGGVKVYYAISPHLDTVFRFATCVERTRDCRIHNEIGIISVVRNLINLRSLNFPFAEVTPHSIFRCSMRRMFGPNQHLRDPTWSSDSESSSSGGDDDGDDDTDSDSSSSDSDSDESDDDRKLPKPRFKVMAGSDMFDARKEIVVLLPDLIKGVSGRPPTALLKTDCPDERFAMRPSEKRLRWRGVAFNYIVAPYLDLTFQFATCGDQTETGDIPSHTVVTLVSNVIRLRHLNIDAESVCLQSIYRCSHTDVISSRRASTEEGKREFYTRLRMLDGEFYNPRTDVIVLVPESDRPFFPPSGLLNPKFDEVERSTSDGASPDGPEQAAEFAPAAYDAGEFMKGLHQRLIHALHGLESQSEDLANINSEVFKKIINECFMPWSIPSNDSQRRMQGILIHGPPGSGKTFLVERLIKSLGLTFTSTDGSCARFSAGTIEEGKYRLQQEASMCFEDRTKLYFMLLDGIDTLGADRSIAKKEQRRSDWLDEFVKIIGDAKYRNLFFIATCGNPERLDSDLSYFGRLDNHYHTAPMRLQHRVDMLCKSVAVFLTSAVRWKLLVTMADVHSVLESNTRVKEYFARNTVNLTFDQLDAVCIDIEGQLRTLCWSQSSQAGMLAELVPILAASSGDVKIQLLNAVKDRLIDACLNASVASVIQNFLKASTDQNLAYNRYMLDFSDSPSVPAVNYSNELRAYLSRETDYHATIMPPTGRFIISTSSKRYSSPRLLVEQCRNPNLISKILFAHKSIPLNTFYRMDNLVSSMVQPLVESRGHEWVMIVNHETVRDKIATKVLTELFEDTRWLAKHGTRCLVVIKVDDLANSFLDTEPVDLPMVQEVKKKKDKKGKQPVRPGDEKKSAKRKDKQLMTNRKLVETVAVPTAKISDVDAARQAREQQILETAEIGLQKHLLARSKERAAATVTSKAVVEGFDAETVINQLGLDLEELRPELRALLTSFFIERSESAAEGYNGSGVITENVEGTSDARSSYEQSRLEKALNDLRMLISKERSSPRIAIAKDAVLPSILETIRKWATPNGPDILFVLEKDSLLDIIQSLIGWGDCRAPLRNNV